MDVCCRFRGGRSPRLSRSVRPYDFPFSIKDRGEEMDTASCQICMETEDDSRLRLISCTSMQFLMKQQFLANSSELRGKDA